MRLSTFGKPRVIQQHHIGIRAGGGAVVWPRETRT